MSLRDSHSAAGRTQRGSSPKSKGGWWEESLSRSDMSYGRRRSSGDGHVRNVPHSERLYHDRCCNSEERLNARPFHLIDHGHPSYTLDRGCRWTAIAVAVA